MGAGMGRGWRGVYRLLVLPSLGHCRRQLISSDGQGILIVCNNCLAQSNDENRALMPCLM